MAAMTTAKSGGRASSAAVVTGDRACSVAFFRSSATHWRRWAAGMAKKFPRAAATPPIRATAGMRALSRSVTSVAAAASPLYADVLAAQPAPRPGAAPVVLLHGLLGSATNWRTVGLELRRELQRDVVALDLPGHGRSPPPPAPLTLESMADAVASTLRARPWSSHWDVVGHSLGGKVAAMLALRHPALVRSLAIVDISLAPYAVESPEWQYVARGVAAVAAVDAAAHGSRKEVDEALARANGGALAAEPLLRGFIGQNVVIEAGSPPRLAWRIDARLLAESMPAFADFPAPPPTGPYDVSDALPVLAVRGGASAYLPLDGDGRHVSTLRAFFPQSRVATVAGASHFVHADKPREVVALLRDFLGG